MIFGHIHRRGSLSEGTARLPGTPIWRHDGVTLHNTGNWLYAEALLGMAVPQSPFWPGSMIVVGEAGPPELIELLGDVDREVLARSGRTFVRPPPLSARRSRRATGAGRAGARSAIAAPAWSIARRVAGEVDDQRPAADPGDAAGEHPVRGVLARGERASPRRSPAPRVRSRRGSPPGVTSSGEKPVPRSSGPARSPPSSPSGEAARDQFALVGDHLAAAISRPSRWRTRPARRRSRPRPPPRPSRSRP